MGREINRVFILRGLHCCNHECCLCGTKILAVKEGVQKC